MIKSRKMTQTYRVKQIYSQLMKNIIDDFQTSSELQHLIQNIHKIVKPVFALGR